MVTEADLVFNTVHSNPIATGPVWPLSTEGAASSIEMCHQDHIHWNPKTYYKKKDVKYLTNNCLHINIMV